MTKQAPRPGALASLASGTLYSDRVITPFTAPLARHFRNHGVRTWLIGGNAVELVTGRDIRPHDDIDFLVHRADAHDAVRVLASLGFTHLHGSVDDGDVFYRRDDLIVDLVPIDPDVTPPRTLGKLATVPWPEGLLTPLVVTVGGEEITTLTPDMHRRMKDIVAAFFGVQPREKDLLDIRHLDAVLSSERT